jgi:hypothetical protein
VEPACDPSTQEAEAGGLQVQGHPELHNENLSPKNKKTTVGDGNRVEVGRKWEDNNTGTLEIGNGTQD